MCGLQMDGIHSSVCPFPLQYPCFDDVAWMEWNAGWVLLCESRKPEYHDLPHRNERKDTDRWERYEQIGGTIYDTLTGHTADYRSPL